MNRWYAVREWTPNFILTFSRANPKLDPNPNPDANRNPDPNPKS